jgi:tetratricopeptide (TPR) repeat protein
MKVLVLLSSVAAVGALVACSPAAEKAPASADSAATPKPEATSLLGKPLFPRTIAPETRTTLEANLAAAKASYDRAPDNADSVIWYGRRLAYLERYQDAIATFSEGIQKHPDDARFYRHRGHRYITIREFDKAIADFDKAADLVKGKVDSLEPDGAPNARNIPTSTQHGNIFYHLALAHYLKADYEKSLAAWQEAMRISTNDDTKVAVSDWMYMTLRRLGRDAEAKKVLEPITPALDVMENTAYHRRLLLYKGQFSVDSLLNPASANELQFVTQGYGVANWYLANGDSAKANEILDKVLASNYWAAFGFIAAEADVARRGK